MYRKLNAKLHLSLVERVAGIGSWRVDLLDNKLYWSDHIFTIHGVTRETYEPDLESAIGFYHPDDLERVNKAVNNAIAKKENFEFELRIIRADDAIRWVHSKGECELNEEGDVVAVNGIFQDITDRYLLSKRLEESEERFSMAIQGSQSGIWDWINVNEDEEWWSPQFYKLLGYNDKEIPATLENFGKALHPEDTERTFDLVKKHFEGKADFDIEYRLRGKSGQYRWFQGYGVTNRDEQGRPTRMVGSIIDIHDRKITQERINTFFDLSIDLVCVAKNDYFLEINPSFERTLGYSREELLSRSYLEFLHPDDLSSTTGEIHNLNQGVITQKFENRYRHKNGSYVWLSWSAQLDLDQGLIYAIARDVTKEKERKRLLDDYTTALQQRNKDLDDFAYIASHDLKAPLRAVDNLASWIEEDAAEVLPTPSKQHLQQLRQRVNRLERLLEDLLHYSRAGRSDYDSEPVQCRELIDSVVAALNPASNTVVNIPQDLPEIHTHKLPLYQVFLNLIGNAIKHSDKEVPIVDISWKNGADTIAFTIADNGPGIEEQYMDRIFKIFHTLKPRDEVEGSGVGLAIVKKLVHSYSGEVTVNTTPGKGAAFTFTWPYAIQPSTTTRPL